MHRHTWRSVAVAVAVVIALTAAPAAAQKPQTPPAAPAPSGAELVGVTANNMFAQAFPIERQGIFSGTNTSANREPGEPRHAAGNRGGHSVWFTWVPAYTRDVVISTRSSDFDTLLGVYRGRTMAELRRIASNDDVPPRLTSRVEFRAFAGNQYRIAVDGYRYGDQTAQTASAGLYVLRLLDA